MKRISIFLALLCALFAFSCKKDSDTNTKPAAKVYDILQISVNEAYQKVSIAINASKPMKIPVEVSAVSIGGVPPAVSMLNDVVASVKPQGIIECTIEEDGVSIEPKAEGNATLTLSPKTLLGEPVSCEVTVTEKPAEPASVEIITTDSHFTGKTLKLLEGDSFPLQAVVKNDKGFVTSDPVTWSITKGAAYVSIDTGGHLTTQAAGSAIVSVSVDGYSELEDQIEVQVQAKPTGVSFYDIYIPNDRYVTKVGEPNKTFTYNVFPSTAYDDFKVSVSNSRVKATLDPSKKKVTLTWANTSSASPTTVTVYSKSNPSASKSFDVYIFDYESNDLKPGDYVYYGQILSEKKEFTYVDCGLRYSDATTSVYELSDGSFSSSPRPYNGDTWSTMNFVGVVVEPVVPDLECDDLSRCENKDESLLYGYRNFTKDNLKGINGNHALVIKKNETPQVVDWQKEGYNEYVAICPAQKKSTDIYQSQLYRQMAFCKESYEKGFYYKPSGSSNPTHDNFSRYYFKCGFVPYLLFKFYSDYVNDSNYEVIPTRVIDAYNDVPKFSKSSGQIETTGWFLPGSYEWEKISEKVRVLNASLRKVNAAYLGGDYWSTEEYDEYQAYVYQVDASQNTVKRTLFYKDRRERADKTASAYTRAVLYL